MSFESILNLSDLDGSNGLVINGIGEGDLSGRSVSNAGDVNGDGIDDLIIGAFGADPAGESYVVFGSTNSFGTSFELSSLDGSNGFTIRGVSEFDGAGISVSGAGDINGDGIDDLIIGAFGANDDAGASYVVFGSTDDFDASFSLSNLSVSDGFAINGIDQGFFGARLGASVSSAGDFNGDGIDDLIIGAYDATTSVSGSAGESYVIFGSNTGFPASTSVAGLNGTNGFVIEGIDFGGRFGTSVSNAGDFNGDGFDDLIIGAPIASSAAGKSYVVHGSNGSFDPRFDLNSLDGSNGFVIPGLNVGDRLGQSVSGAGDINGDGFDDLIIGSPLADPNSNNRAGESYVVLGSGHGFGASFDLNSLDGSNGFIINGIDANDNLGSSVSSAGDINGDGFDDLIIAANIAAPNGTTGAGESYVIFGTDSGFAASLELTNLDGSNGFVLNGVDPADYSGTVSGAGDINGDGIDDLIIGAASADPNGISSGESYVVFGRSNNVPNNDAPNAIDDAVSVNEDTVVSGNLLTNDSDPNSDPLTVIAVNGNAADVDQTVTLSSGALVTLNADGTFDYNPNGQFEDLNDGEQATDGFNYTISDGQDSDTATVNITITGKSSDLVATTFDVMSDQVLGGTVSLTYTLENLGLQDAGAFTVDIVYSDDAIIGNEGDQVVDTLSFAGLAAGDALTGMADVQLPIDELNANALEEDPTGQENGYISRNIDYLGLVIDPSNSVLEANETNNANRGKGIDSDDITYFPWDIDGSEQVTPSDAIFVINRLGQTTTPENALADFDGSGQITPSDAIAVINRLGYGINPTVIESTV